MTSVFGADPVATAAADAAAAAAANPPPTSLDPDFPFTVLPFPYDFFGLPVDPAATDNGTPNTSQPSPAL